MMLKAFYPPGLQRDGFDAELDEARHEWRYRPMLTRASLSRGYVVDAG